MDLLLDPFRMIKDIRANLPKSVSRWGGALNIPQAIGGLVFVGRPEGVLVLASWFLGMVIAGRIHRHRPFSKLIGICHVTWLPVLPFLLGSLIGGGHDPVFFAWLTYVVVTMVISLLLDIRDIDGYVRKSAVTFDPAGSGTTT